MPESPLYVTGTRILTPTTFDALLSSIKKPYHRTIFNVLFYTGMRYIEMQRVWRHAEWVLTDRQIIDLPKEAQKKVKRSAPMRYIPIPPQIRGELPYFFENKKPPIIQGWDENMKRWGRSAGIGSEGLSAKTTRKTIESWMYIAGIDPMDICGRQGHDNLTSLRHYKLHKTAFTDGEVVEIKNRLAGW